jgi:hypothetical protein
MDLEAEKAKRDARIQAKKEIIRNELGATSEEPAVESEDKVNAEGKEGDLDQGKEGGSEKDADSKEDTEKTDKDSDKVNVKDREGDLGQKTAEK